MLICESNLARAVRIFLNEAKIPRPNHMNKQLDKAFVKILIIPAFLEALKEIEEVNLCAGFDIEQAAAMFGQGRPGESNGYLHSR